MRRFGTLFVGTANWAVFQQELERRTARGGKDSVDHAPGGRDDVANVVAGLAHCAVSRFTSSVSELRI
jgi:hypothetical protein